MQLCVDFLGKHSRTQCEKRNKSPFKKWDRKDERMFATKNYLFLTI